MGILNKFVNLHNLSKLNFLFLKLKKFHQLQKIKIRFFLFFELFKKIKTNIKNYDRYFQKNM